jgi:hypothetical protein
MQFFCDDIDGTLRCVNATPVHATPKSLYTLLSTLELGYVDILRDLKIEKSKYRFPSIAYKPTYGMRNNKGINGFSIAFCPL